MLDGARRCFQLEVAALVRLRHCRKRASRILRMTDS